MLAQGLKTKVIRHVSSYRLDFQPMDGGSEANFMQKRGEEYTRKRHNIAVLKGIGVGLGLFPFMEGISADYIRRFALAASHSLFTLAIVVEFVIISAPIFLCLLIADWLQYRINLRYGISVQKPLSAVTDMLRRVALRMGMFTATILLIYGSYELLNSWWWMGAGIGLGALWTTYIYIFPTVILPLFFKLEPVTGGSLRSVIHSLTVRAGVTIEQVFSLKISEKFNLSNMAIGGIGKHRMLILTDTILRDCSPPELEALVAHELGHVRNHDVEKRAAGLAALSLISCWVAALTLRSLHISLGNLDSLPALCGALLIPYCLGVLVLARLWRNNEFRADEFAFRLIGDTAPFVTALKRISEKNLIQVTPKNQHRFSHPATQERIRRAQAFSSPAGLKKAALVEA
jgi:STE24 endopeptidase